VGTINAIIEAFGADLLLWWVKDSLCAKVAIYILLLIILSLLTYIGKLTNDADILHQRINYYETKIELLITPAEIMFKRKNSTNLTIKITSIKILKDIVISFNAPHSLKFELSEESKGTFKPNISEIGNQKYYHFTALNEAKEAECHLVVNRERTYNITSDIEISGDAKEATPVKRKCKISY